MTSMKRLALAAVCTLTVLLLLPGTAPAIDLARGAPADLGFDPAKLAAIDQHIADDVDQGHFPGAVLAIVRRDQLVHFKTYGKQTPAGGAMPEDAIFRIYSMTKPIASLAVMQLVEAGKLAVDDPLHEYLPAFKDMKVHENGADVPARRPITIEDLLRHTSGLSYGFFGTGHVRDLYREHKLLNPMRTNEEFIAAVAALPLEHHPGEVWEYSMSVDVLGRVVEVVSGQPLDAYLEDHVLGPLGMTATGFHVPADDIGRVAAPNDGVRLSPADGKPKMRSGGGGLFSTMADYLRFTRMLAHGGELDGQRVIGEKTLALMTSDHLGERPRGLWDGPGPAHGFGYGFAVRTQKDGGRHPGNVGDFWWGGYAGTYFWVDPQAELIVVYMMQSPQQREPYRLWLRQSVYDAMTG